MHQTDFPRFKAVMVGMAKLYGAELDGLVLDAYWLALGDWELIAFEQGAAHLMRVSKFMPRPAEFHELRKGSRPTAGEAWALVLAHVRSGAYRTGRLEDDRVDLAVRAVGGYGAVAMSATDQTPFLERRFAEHYESIQDAEDLREALPQIAGPSTLRISGPGSAADLLPQLPRRSQ